METPYDSKYSLSKLNYDEYIFDPKFKIFGIGVQFDTEDPQFIDAPYVDEFIHDLDWPDYEVVCQNTYFDGAALAWLYGVKPAYWYDTMSMYRLLYPKRSASLDKISRHLWPTDPTMHKGTELIEAKGHLEAWPEEHKESLIGYCLQDVKLTHAIFMALKDEIPRQEFFMMDDTLRKFFYPTLELDPAVLEEAIAREAQEKEEILELVGLERTQLASNEQFADILRANGVTPPLKISPTTGKNTYAFSKNDLKFQELQLHEDDRIRLLVNARMRIKSTQVETRAKTLMFAARCHNNKCPIPLKSYAAHTLRYGGMDKRNFQNFPRDGNLRAAIIPPPGHVMYIVDYAAIEARMLAWLAKFWTLVDSFAAGVDIYVAFAAELFGVRPDEVTKLQRFIGKVAILGLGYGMGADKFRLILAQGAMGPKHDIERHEAFRIVNLYRTLNHPIRVLWSYFQEEISRMDKGIADETYGPLHIKNDRIYLPNDTYIQYDYDGLSKTFGGKITENVVQALSRIVLVDAIERIYNELGIRCSFHVHDELVFALPENEAEQLQTEIENLMIIPPSWAEKLPLAVEGQFTPCYTK